MKHGDHAGQGAHCAPRGYNWILVAFLAVAGSYFESVLD